MSEVHSPFLTEEKVRNQSHLAAGSVKKLFHHKKGVGFVHISRQETVEIIWL